MIGFYKVEYFSNRKTCDHSFIRAFRSVEDCRKFAEEGLKYSKLWTKTYIYYLGDLDNNIQEIKNKYGVEIHYNNLLQPVAEIMK